MGSWAVSVTSKVAWNGSSRRHRLPANWSELRDEGERRNPRHICHICGLPGGSDFDHKNGDWSDNRQENLDWAHSRADVLAGRSQRNCHGQKSSREGNAARYAFRDPPMKHPGLL